MGTVVEFIPAEQASKEETLTALAKQPNLKFLKIFPRKGPLTRQRVVEAFQDAFEQIGGVSRLSLWADSHPEEFFKLYARLLPAASSPELEGQKEFIVRHILPPTKLDQPEQAALPSPASEEPHSGG